MVLTNGLFFCSLTLKARVEFRTSAWIHFQVRHLTFFAYLSNEFCITIFFLGSEKFDRMCLFVFAIEKCKENKHVVTIACKGIVHWVVHWQKKLKFIFAKGISELNLEISLIFNTFLQTQKCESVRALGCLLVKNSFIQIERRRFLYVQNMQGRSQ